MSCIWHKSRVSISGAVEFSHVMKIYMVYITFYVACYNSLFCNFFCYPCIFYTWIYLINFITIFEIFFVFMPIFSAVLKTNHTLNGLGNNLFQSCSHFFGDLYFHICFWSLWLIFPCLLPSSFSGVILLLWLFQLTLLQKYLTSSL